MTGLGTLDVGDIEWTLEWASELSRDRHQYWVQIQFSSLLAQHGTRAARDRNIADFNQPNSKFRRLLLYFVLPDLKEITTDRFSDDAISFALADLKNSRTRSWPSHCSAPPPLRPL